MNRREHLKRQLDEELRLLQEYEELARTETDPRLQRRYRANISRQKETIQELEQELAQLPANPQSFGFAQDRSPISNLRFYANAPYGLESGFTGRTAELALLDNWLTNDPDHSLLALVALGGTGKSALAWYWQQRLAEAVPESPLQAIIWWDFYQPSTSVAEFLNDALAFFDDQPQQYGNSRLQLNRLFEHLRRTPALLVLDGAERLLRVYSRMDAAYLDDVEAETGQPHGRDCVDPVAASLLTGLAQMQGQSKTLLASRLLPRELGGRGGGLLQGVYRHDLAGLDPEDAYRLFKGRGIQATRAEVRAVAAPLGYHPLSLALLAGYLADDPRAPNDLRAAAIYNPTDDLLGRRQHVLKQAYDSLPSRTRHLLSRLAAFRGSVAWETIEAIMGGGKRVRDDLNLLQRRGLLQRTARDGVTIYDLHPIVRRYAYDRLADPAATHAQLVVYFEAVPEPERVQSLADLAPAIELYHHLARAGKYDEAFALFRDRINKSAYYQFGAYQLQIELLRALFPDGEDKPPRLSDESAQAWTLNALANSYSLSGQPAAAVSLFEQSNTIDEKRGNKKGVAIGLGNLATQQSVISALAAAQEALRLAGETARTRFPVERDYVQVYWLLGWARLLLDELDRAQAHLDEALRRGRAINLVELEPAILLAQARLVRPVKRNAISFNYAQEALQIAERAGYRLDLADVHNFLAQLAFDEGNQSLARQHAQKGAGVCLVRWAAVCLPGGPGRGRAAAGVGG